MRVDAQVLLRVRRAVHVEALEDVDRLPVRAVHRLLERGLESRSEIEDVVGRAHRLHVACRQLVVVRLGAGRREVSDLELVAGDALGCEGKRIEGRDDRGAILGGGPAAAAAGRQSRGCEQSRNDQEKLPLVAAHAHRSQMP